MANAVAINKYDYVLPDHRVEYGVMVEIESLRIDAQAQRTLNEARAQGICRKLVPTAVGTITVSQRSDGTRYVVDGMHRRRGCQLAGWTEIAAEVHHGLTRDEEAVLFLIKNRESRAPSAFDEFKVGLTAGVPMYVDINRILVEHGLTAGPNTSANQIGAVRGLEDIARRYGADVLDQTLTVAELAWGREAGTWDGTLIGGIGEFLGLHGKDIDHAKLAAKIARSGNPNKWLGLATSYMALGVNNGVAANAPSKRHACYVAIKSVWNKGTRADSRIA